MIVQKLIDDAKELFIKIAEKNQDLIKCHAQSATKGPWRERLDEWLADAVREHDTFIARAQMYIQAEQPGPEVHRGSEELSQQAHQSSSSVPEKVKKLPEQSAENDERSERLSERSQ